MKKVRLIEQFVALSNQANLSKKEAAQLHKLRRALEVAGIPTNISAEEMMDYAIVIDNMGRIKGFLDRSSDRKMRYARKSNGKKAGKIVANGIEADAIKALGLSTIDTKRLEKIISEIAVNKKAVDKVRKTHYRANPDKRFDIDPDDAYMADEEETEWDEEGFDLADEGLSIIKTVAVLATSTAVQAQA